MDNFDYNDPIFELLNCYEIDGSEIHNGMAHIDSSEAEELTKKIRKLLPIPNEGEKEMKGGTYE